MGLYTISYGIHGYVDFNIEADSRAAAIEQAQNLFDKADFGPLEDIDGYIARVTDPHNCIYYEDEVDMLIEEENNE